MLDGLGVLRVFCFGSVGLRMIPKRPNGLNYDCMGVWTDRVCHWCMMSSRCSATKTICRTAEMLLRTMTNLA